jgi:hypothetical protein
VSHHFEALLIKDLSEFTNLAIKPGDDAGQIKHIATHQTVSI